MMERIDSSRKKQKAGKEHEIRQIADTDSYNPWNQVTRKADVDNIFFFFLHYKCG